MSGRRKRSGLEPRGSKAGGLLAASRSAAGVLAVALGLGLPLPTGALERELEEGLAYLRAGNQEQAVELLQRYRGREADAETRRTVDQVLVLLSQPLQAKAQASLASVLADSLRARPAVGKPLRLDWRGRNFPPFP